MQSNLFGIIAATIKDGNVIYHIAISQHVCIIRFSIRETDLLVLLLHLITVTAFLT